MKKEGERNHCLNYITYERVLRLNIGYNVLQKALFLLNWINACHNNVVKTRSDWRIQQCTVPHLKFQELPLHGTLSRRFLLMNQKCSWNTDFVIANTPTGDYYMEMKNSVEDAFHQQDKKAEVQRPCVTLPVRRRIGSAPLRQPVVPGNRNAFIPPSLLQKPWQALPGQLSFRDTVSNKQWLMSLIPTDCDTAFFKFHMYFSFLTITTLARSSLSHNIRQTDSVKLRPTRETKSHGLKSSTVDKQDAN